MQDQTSSSAFTLLSTQLVERYTAFVAPVATTLQEYLFAGGIKKGGSWGGPKCSSFVGLDIHVYETIGWSLFILGTYRFFRLNKMVAEIWNDTEKLTSTIRLEKKAAGGSTFTHILERFVDLILCSLHLASFLLLLYYKTNLHSLINMFQPCHVALVLQMVALYSTNELGIIIGVLLLPMTLGSLMAILWPATDGLTQPYEYESFWLLHTLIQFTPLHLLIRKNFAAYKLASLPNLLYGNWLNMIYHWWFVEPVNTLFSVNINFMLCPAEAMANAFKAFPDWIVNCPSYRTFMCTAFFSSNLITAYLYISVAGVIFFGHSFVFHLNPKLAAVDRGDYEDNRHHPSDSELKKHN